MQEDESLLVFLPLAHVFARTIQVGGLKARSDRWVHRRHQEPDAVLAMFQPTFILSVPRVFEKVYNSAEQNAANDGKGKIFQLAAQTAIALSEAQDGGPGLVLRPKHAVFDKLVYAKLRAALGGDCSAPCPGALRWARGSATSTEASA